MSYTLITSDSQLFNKVRTCLPRAEEITVVERWSSSDTNCWKSSTVIAAENVNSARVAQQLSAVKQAAPLKVAIAVIEVQSPQYSQPFLHSLRLDAIVPVEKIEKELWASIRKARLRQRLNQLVIAAGSTSHLAPVLCKALTILFDRSIPIATVDQLAAAVACDRRTLWYHWNKSMAKSTSLRLSDFVDLLLLFHAESLKSDFVTWDTVAHELSIHIDTLTRICKRLIGCTPANLMLNREGVVWEVIKGNVAEVLSSERPLDKLLPD